MYWEKFSIARYTLLRINNVLRGNFSEVPKKKRKKNETFGCLDRAPGGEDTFSVGSQETLTERSSYMKD